MKPVTSSLLQSFGEDYEASAERRIATLALSKSELNSVAFCSKGAGAMRQKFSVEVPTLEVTNQKASGRCWLFAATNVLRERIAADPQSGKFRAFPELSRFLGTNSSAAITSWRAFWKPPICRPNDRTVMHILSTGVHDGGQWDMFANIVRKYGVVPKDVYDETYQSSNTRNMNAQL